MEKEVVRANTVVFIASFCTFYGYAFRLDLDDETYFFTESNYYTIKVKKKDSEINVARLEALVLDHLIHSYTDLGNPRHSSV